MKLILRLCCVMLLFATASYGQTTTTAGGDWQTPGNWSAGVPGATTTATVAVGHAMTLSAPPVTVTTGVYNFNANVSSSFAWTFNNGSWLVSTCVLDIKAGTTTISGLLTATNANIYVRNGATLIVGGLTTGGATKVIVEATGTLIVNGNWLDNTTSSGLATINGYARVNGNWSNTSITANAIKIDGAGQMYTTGSISTASSARAFGTQNNCTTPTCSGRALSCGVSSLAYSTSLLPATQTVCSDVAAGTITHMVGSTIGTRQWQVSSTGPGWGYTDIVGATGATYTPPITAGSRWYRVYYTISGCAIQYLSLNMYSQPVEVVDPTILATAGSDFAMSFSNPVVNLSGNTPNYGIGVWSIVSGPSISPNQFDAINSGNSGFRPYKEGVYVLRWTLICGNKSDDVQVTVSGTNSTTWTGSTDTDWHTGSNWSNGVPTQLTNVTIPVTANAPTMSVSGLAKSCTVNSTATLTVTGGAYLKVHDGVLTVNGILAGVPRVRFNGGTTSYVGTYVPNIYNLHLDNTALTFETNANLITEVSLEYTATFDPDGAGNAKIFSLQSTDDDPDVTARIAAIPSGSSIIGKVRFKRYMDAYEKPPYDFYSGVCIGCGYHFRGFPGSLPSLISIPVIGATVQDFQQEVHVSGNFIGYSTNCQQSNGCNIYQQLRSGAENPTNGGHPWQTPVWPQFPVIGGSNTAVFQTNHGYWYWRTGSAYSDNDVTWNVNGIPVQGNVTVPVTYTVIQPDAVNNGWFLFPNPYCSTIDLKSWETGGILNMESLTGTFQTYDIMNTPDWWNPKVISYNINTGLSINGGTQYLVAGQSLWAQADWGDTFPPPSNISTSITITENAKTSYTGPEVLFTSLNNMMMASATPSIPHVKLKVTQGVYKTETVIGFKAGATSAPNRKFDVYRTSLPNIASSTFTCNTKKNGNIYDHNIVALDSIKNTRLDVVTYGNVGYAYTLSWTISNMSDARMRLYDKELNVYVDMATTSSYAYTGKANNAAGRFKVIFSEYPPTVPTLLGSSKGTILSNSTSLVVTYPTGIKKGELLVLGIAYDGNNSLLDMNGFSAYRYNGGAGGAVTSHMLWKYANGTESGNITFTSSASEQASWVMMRFPVNTYFNNGDRMNLIGYTSPSGVSMGIGEIQSNNLSSEQHSVWSIRMADGNKLCDQPEPNWTKIEEIAGGSNGATVTIMKKNVDIPLGYLTAYQGFNCACLDVAQSGEETNVYGFTLTTLTSIRDITIKDLRGKYNAGATSVGIYGTRTIGNGKTLARVRTHFHKQSNTSNPITLKIYTSSGTSPNSLPDVLVATSNVAMAFYGGYATSLTQFTFATPLKLVDGTPYWIVFENAGNTVRWNDGSLPADSEGAHNGAKSVSGSWTTDAAVVLKHLLIFED